MNENDLSNENKVFLGTQLSENQLTKFKSILYSKDPILQNLSLISASKHRDIAEMFGKDIIEIAFDELYNGFLLDEDEVVIPPGNTFEIDEIELYPDKTIIKLRSTTMEKIQKKKDPYQLIALQRIQKDIEGMALFSYKKLNSQYTHFKVLIPGQDIYENGLFQLDFRITPDYPFKPPRVRFDTKILHPNVNPKTGKISLDLLKERWTPAITFENLLLYIQELLRFPNFDEMFGNLSEKESYDCKEAFIRDAKKMVEKYADKRKEIENLRKEGVFGKKAIRKLIKTAVLNNL